MRLGDSDRALDKTGLIGRPKVKALRAVASEQQGWLSPATPLPDESVFAKVFASAATQKRSSSNVEPYRSFAERWAELVI